MPAAIPRWGLPACALAWICGLLAAGVGAGLAALAVVATGGEVDADSTVVLAASLVAQGVGVLLAVWLISVVRGRGTLGADFGFGVRLADWPWLILGAALLVASGLLVLPLRLVEPDHVQGVVESFEQAGRGLEIVVFAVAVVALAPVVEELLFRGLLLRALLRRTTPGWAVVWSASLFAGVHIVLDPSVGAAQALPALVILGLVTGDQAVRTRSLSRPILLHAGFNMLTAVSILVL